MTDDQSKLGRALRGYRKQKRKSQAVVAARARVSVNTLRNLERGKGRASSLARVLRALGLEMKLDGSRTQHPLQKLEDVRLSRDYSQRFVAEKLRVSRNTLGRIERGAGVHLGSIEAYAEAIDAPLYLAPVKKKSRRR